MQYSISRIITDAILNIHVCMTDAILKVQRSMNGRTENLHVTADVIEV